MPEFIRHARRLLYRQEERIRLFEPPEIEVKIPFRRPAPVMKNHLPLWWALDPESDEAQQQLNLIPRVIKNIDCMVLGVSTLNDLIPLNCKIRTMLHAGCGRGLWACGRVVVATIF